MKVAFLSANRIRLPQPVIPIGLLYVMESCPPGHDRELWDVCFADDPAAYLREKLEAFAPDLVAMGMRNIQNADYTGTWENIDLFGTLMETIRAHSDAKVVMGGSGFSVLPDGLMEKFRPEYGIAGEGEEAFPALVNALARGDTNPVDVPGLLYFADGALTRNASAPEFLELDTVAVPDRTAVDDRYYGHGAVDSIQTKRGCPLKCTYCTYPLVEGRRNRVRDPEKVADEFERVQRDRPDVKHVFVVDSVFNLPIRHAKSVCRTLVERNNKLGWTCYANPIAFDEELARLMVDAGCEGAEIGSDSGVDDVLVKLKKGFDSKAIYRMKSICREVGLKDCHSFILGTEGETLDDVKRSLDFIEELDAYASILMSWVDDYEALDPAYAKKRLAFREQVNAMILERSQAHRRWILPQMGVQFEAKLFNFLGRMGLVGPHWLHIDLAEGDLGALASRFVAN
jgi:radical SAM superfamily enzyme YgiQ (UPF0313 family)